MGVFWFELAACVFMLVQPTLEHVIEGLVKGLTHTDRESVQLLLLVFCSQQDDWCHPYPMHHTVQLICGNCLKRCRLKPHWRSSGNIVSQKCKLRAALKQLGCRWGRVAAHQQIACGELQSCWRAFPAVRYVPQPAVILHAAMCA